MIAFFEGAGTGAGLIIAIGAQNAYVLAQGIRREYYLLVAAICSLCDIFLIAIGVSGVGTLVASNPLLQKTAAWGGAIFLAYYGFLALKSARSDEALALKEQQTASLKTVLASSFAVSLLNPHVYLDTVVLLGGIGGQFATTDRLLFASGASLSSIVWFFSLSIGGKLLAPFFQKPMAWKILYSFVCLVMWVIAAQLLVLATK